MVMTGLADAGGPIPDVVFQAGEEDGYGCALHGVQGAPELYDTDPILQASVPKRTLDELFQEADNVHR